MNRGQIVIAGAKGAFTGKPRPWLVVQSDTFLDTPSSVTVCMISTSAMPATFRVPLDAGPASGLEEASVILCDKIVTLRADAIQSIVGQVDVATMVSVDRALRQWLDL